MPILNLPLLAGREILGKSILEELVRKYQVEAPLIYEKIKQAHRLAKRELFYDQAHLLKGVSANIGAQEVALVCEKLQHASERGQEASTLSQLEALPQLIEAALEALREYISRL